MTVKDDPRENLAQLVAMVSELDRYLDAGRPYRSVVADWPGGGHETVTLSLGVVLDLVAVLERSAARLTDDERGTFADAVARLRVVRAGRRDDYGAMLTHELHSQLDAWRWFVDDCTRGECAGGDLYRREVARRRRVDQLLTEGATLGLDLSEARDRTAALDRALRNRFVPGAYCGPPGEEQRYPRAAYWWLYGRPEGDGGD